MNIPLLSIIIFLPLIGVGFLSLIRNNSDDNAKDVGIWISFINFVLTVFLYIRFDKFNFEYQFTERHEWIKDMGISYYVGIDGLSLCFIMLTALLIHLCIVFSKETVHKRVRKYIIAFLLLETMVIGSFSAINLSLFYLFFEGTLIPLFLIIGIWGSKDRMYACFKFFLYTLFGSVFMLLAIAKLYSEFGTSDLTELLNQNMSFDLEMLLFLAFTLAMAVKLPMVPFHTWLPAAHSEAPAAGSVVLAGVLLKMGGYGLARIAIPMFPSAADYCAPIIMTMSVFAIIYAAAVALAQNDMKKVIAYSSVSHMGFVSLGLFGNNLQSVTGAIVLMIGHGLVSSGLFFVLGMIYDRFHSRNIDEYGGLSQRFPKMSKFFLILIFASVAVPGSINFVGEFFIIVGTLKQNTILAFCAALGMIMAPVYSLRIYKNLFGGALVLPKGYDEKQHLQDSEDTAKSVPHDYKYYISGSVTDLKFYEKSILTVLILLVLLIGIYPRSVTDIVNRTVRAKVLAENAESILKENADD